MMEVPKVCVVVLLILAFCVSSLTAGKKNGKSKKAQNIFRVDIGDGKTALVKFKAKNDVYEIKCKSKSLKNAGYEKSTIVFDYQGENNVTVLATGKKKSAFCFFMNTTVSQSDLELALAGMKNNNVTFSTTLIFDGRAAAMSKSEKKAWLKKAKSVKRLCRKSKIVEVTELDPNANLTSTENKTFIGLDGFVEIVRDVVEPDSTGSDDKKNGGNKNDNDGESGKKKGNKKNKKDSKKKGNEGNKDDNEESGNVKDDGSDDGGNKKKKKGN